MYTVPRVFRVESANFPLEGMLPVVGRHYQHLFILAQSRALLSGVALILVVGNARFPNDREVLFTWKCEYYGRSFLEMFTSPLGTVSRTAE